MKVEVQLIHLQAWAQEEISAQSALLQVLRGMEASVLSGKPDELAASGEALEAALLGNRNREKKRVALMKSLAQYFSVPLGIVSLTSLIVRLGAEGHDTGMLSNLRDRLRECVQEVSNRSRTLTIMASHHQGVLADLMTIIGASSQEEETRKHGVLVDAEA